MLLHKQDEILRLEDRLQVIDSMEPRPLFNGSRRRDKNEARHETLANLDVAMAEYGRKYLPGHSCVGESRHMIISMSSQVSLTCLRVLGDR